MKNLPKNIHDKWVAVALGHTFTLFWGGWLGSRGSHLGLIAARKH